VSSVPKREPRCRPGERKPRSDELLNIHLVQDAQAFEREVRVEDAYLLAVSGDNRGGASGRDGAEAVGPHLGAEAPDQGVYGAGVAVDEAATDGVGGVRGDGPGRFTIRSTPGSLAVREMRASRATLRPVKMAPPR
jgi:hypothetical protein